MIAFSTDSSVAARGVYLLSFLPESDVDRIVDYAIAQGKRSFIALVPDNAYGNVVEASFVSMSRARAAASSRSNAIPTSAFGLHGSLQNVVQAAGTADALFLPGEGDIVAAGGAELATAGVDLKRLQLLGTGLWEDPRIAAAPDVAGRLVSRARPECAEQFPHVRRRVTARATTAIRCAQRRWPTMRLRWSAALVKTQGARGLTNEVLLNPSGFAGIDGVFRFRQDGTNQRGLAVMRVTPNGGQVVSPAPRSLADRGRKLLKPRDRPPPRRAAETPNTSRAGGRRRVDSTKPSTFERLDALGIERPSREREIARGIDAFGQTQPHQQEFVGRFFAR